MQIQWFPGHMAKARRLIDENLPLVDLVIEVMDARVPLSGDNPDFDRMLGTKRRLMVFTKCDMADPAVTAGWESHFRGQGIPAVFICAKERKQAMEVASAAYGIMSDKTARDAERGRRPQPVKAMIVGIPNVGKSTLINSLAGRAAASTGDKPGVTRGKQWIDVGRIMLLDTPGVLWPRFDVPEIGRRLAYTGAVKDDILDVPELSLEFIRLISDRYPDAITSRFGVEEPASMTPLEVLEEIGRRRGCRLSGGSVDYDKAASLLLHDFREGRMGRITLDRLSDIEVFRAEAERLRLERQEKGKRKNAED